MFTLPFKQIVRTLKYLPSVPHWLSLRIPFGQQLFMVRTALGMTQAQLAKKVGGSQNAVARLEKNLGDPCLSTLAKMAGALDCELIIRLVPKENIEHRLTRLAKNRAAEIIKMSVASANLEVQRPSKKTIADELKKMTNDILLKKRSSLWS